MTNEIKANEVYTLPDGSKARWVDGGWVKVEERGPLGGRMVSLATAPFDTPFYARYLKQKHGDLIRVENPNGTGSIYSDHEIALEDGLIYETDIPQCMSGERMTAGDAAQMPGIVGRWVAVKVGDTDYSGAPLGVAYDGEDHAWLTPLAPVILLPEGFGE